MPPLTARLLLVAALFASRLAAQPSLVDLDWALLYGETETAMSEPFDRPAWKAINLGISWERQNLHNGGTAWLKKSFRLPEGIRGKALALELKMGAERIDVFLNGKELAKVARPETLARIDLPASALNESGDNSLVLRVSGHFWTGGSNDDCVRLVPKESPGLRLAADAVFEAKDHVFSATESVRFATRVESEGLKGPVSANLVVISAFHAEVFEQTRTLDAASGPQLEWSVGALQPGFYQGQLRLCADGYHAQKVFWFAVDPTLIPASSLAPSGLDDYWERAKGELAAVPPNFRAIKDEARSDARHTVYTVEMDSVGGVTLRAWYIVPSKPGRHPAVLDVPGYSAAMKPEWFLEDDDLVHLALDIRGHGRSADVVNPGFGTPGFVGFRVNDPENYVYKGAYLDCGRALEFLASRPEVDARRIAVMGGSQGGGLAFASAALFPDKVAACSAGMPFLGAFADHMRIRDVYRAEMQAYVDHYAGCSWLDVYRSLSLVDTVNLARRIRCPVLMCSGLFDDDCPPQIGFAVYNAIEADKRHIIYPDEAHLLGPRWGADSKAWIRRVFGMTQP